MTTADPQRDFITHLAVLADTLYAVKAAPEGTLYAGLMGVMDVNTFQRLVEALVRLGIARREGSHVLAWTAPVPGSHGAIFMEAAITASTARVAVGKAS